MLNAKRLSEVKILQQKRLTVNIRCHDRILNNQDKFEILSFKGTNFLCGNFS